MPMPGRLEALNDAFKAQTNLWETYLNPEYIVKIKEIVSFYPVQAEVLREYLTTLFPQNFGEMRFSCMLPCSWQVLVGL